MCEYKGEVRIFECVWNFGDVAKNGIGRRVFCLVGFWNVRDSRRFGGMNYFSSGYGK